MSESSVRSSHQAKSRNKRLRISRDTAEPLPIQLPPRPEFLRIAPGQVIWRNSLQSDPDLPFRQVTWDVQFVDDQVIIHADLAREGEMREVDFREIHGSLDQILSSKIIAEGIAKWHIQRIRRSLYWQRDIEDLGEHLEPASFDGETGAWGFRISMPQGIYDFEQMPSGRALRAASNEMYLARHEERQWVTYAHKISQWAGYLSLDDDLCECFMGPREVCRMRLLHYWQIPECRQLFLSSKNFIILFCAPGMLPSLDDANDPAWKDATTNLARLPHRELIGLIGLPSTDQAVRLFLRIKPREIVPNLTLIRKAFSNPLALKRLSSTTCGIDEMMLSICQHEKFPFHWPLFRQLCRDRTTCDSALSYIHVTIDFFPDDPISQHIRKLYRRARSPEALQSTTRIANWYRSHWRDLFLPGIQDALGNLNAPLAETESIRHLNRPQELINISATHNLGLGQYLIRITQGEYALYQIRYQDEFAIVGICRKENEPWKIDQIKGTKNTEPTERLKTLVEEWLDNDQTRAIP